MKKVVIPFIIAIFIVISSILIFSPKEEKALSERQGQDRKSQNVKKSYIENLKEKYDFVIDTNASRYEKYQKLYPNLGLEDVITYVNMGLDAPFYENTAKTHFLNDDRILINKYYYAGQDYVPNDLEILDSSYSKGGIKLVKKAKVALEKMILKAKEEGYSLRVISAYRSYDYQKNLYDNYVKNDGVEAADTYSARPGYSEHQSGLVVDLDNYVSSYTSFEKTKEYQWMLENASDYGFILRFPKGKEAITGYQFEAWHYRYVGQDLAKKIKSSNLTFDEYYARYLDPLLQK